MANETPVLPPVENLSANEYREVREGGKSVAEIVKARPDADPVSSSHETQPAESDASATSESRARDDAGKFVKVDEGVIAKNEGEKPKSGNPRHDPRARIDELTREKSEAVRRAESAEAERERYRVKLEAFERGEGPRPKEPEQAKPVEAPTTTGKLEYPVELKSYEAYIEKNPDAAYEDFTDARADFRFEQREQAAEAKRAEAKAREQHEATLKPFFERQAAFKAAHPDFDAVIQRGADIYPPVWVIEHLTTSEHGPALQYHLAQHLDEAHHLGSLTKTAAVAYLKALETSLGVAPTVTTPEAPLTTQADAPFETVGAAPTASSRSLESVAAASDTKSFRRIREQQLAGRR